MNLNSRISQLSGIGDKYSKLLERLGLFTIEDLVKHFPYRYNNFSKTKAIAEIQTEENVKLNATLVSIDNIFTKYGKKLTKAVISDETGKIDIYWFNKHYLKKNLKIDNSYTFYGKVGLFNKKLSLISPEIDFYVKEETDHAEEFLGVYPETAGISSKMLKSKITTILEKYPELFEEHLPSELLKKYDFDQLYDALVKMHNPKDLEEPKKAIKRFQFEELFTELIKVEERKQSWQSTTEGIAMKSKKIEIEKFIKNLPFTLTDDQQLSIDQIVKDMQNNHPMNRMLEGDVGTGKTVVAVIAAYFAILNGYKILYMAPTEILANQHFESFQNFLENVTKPDGEKIKIVLKTGSKRIKLDTDNFDIAIGTHALIFTDEKLDDIGLVIIDEQHRFGVEQRAKLINLNNSHLTPHLLSMTATPIPRTLALTLYGDLSISILKTPPNKDKSIKTWIIPETKREKSYQWINDSGEQAFIVCPFIEESNAESLENVKSAQKHHEELSTTYFKNKRVGLLHGKMKPAEKQATIEDFKSKKLDILVSTPVIEVGVDVPEATIMVIESAERYGLASLHQIRGRVGRGSKEGYCFVFMTHFSRYGYERLKHLERTTSGLELAEIDMKMRGQGDIYGTMQSGFKLFKYANLSDLKMLESAKIEADYYFEKIDQFPKLKQKIVEKNALIAKN